jgi:hypothetical protein
MRVSQPHVGGPDTGNLFDYFYFQGETLAHQLASGSTQAIHDGLATLLHKEEWEHAVDNVQEVRRKIDAQIQKIGEANREYLAKERDLARSGTRLMRAARRS